MAETAIEMCPTCGTEWAPSMTACPGCGRLVHSEQLAALAQHARDATDAGDLSTALASWREALPLLPAGSRQFERVSATITDLGSRLPSGAVRVPASANAKSPASKAAAGLGAAGLFAWKLKALLLGLGKMTTLLSMLGSLGVYWALWGWKFALGFVLSIYVHEMGHVIALRRLGFKATSPMFIPGIGALIRLQQQIVNSREDAEIGLAGPIYGLGAALVSLVIWVVTRQPIFAAIAGIGAWVNLFNLTPFAMLDGGRGFHAMSRVQKLLCTLVVAGAWWYTQDGLLVVVGLLCLSRVFGGPSEIEGSWRATMTYAVLVVALTAISLVRSQAGVR